MNWTALWADSLSSDQIPVRSSSFPAYNSQFRSLVAKNLRGMTQYSTLKVTFETRPVSYQWPRILPTPQYWKQSLLITGCSWLCLSTLPNPGSYTETGWSFHILRPWHRDRRDCPWEGKDCAGTQSTTSALSIILSQHLLVTDQTAAREKVIGLVTVVVVRIDVPTNCMGYQVARDTWQGTSLLF